MEKYNRDIEDPEVKARIEADRSEGLALGVQGTPSLFLDGEQLAPQSYEQLKSELDDALARAAQRDAWFATPASNLAAGSPTTAHVAFEYLRRTRRMSLAQVLRLDLVLAKACQRHHDFAEGVRALLIDKDRQPRWSPDRFEAVDAAHVARHFAPL